MRIIEVLIMAFVLAISVMTMASMPKQDDIKREVQSIIEYNRRVAQ